MTSLERELKLDLVEPFDATAFDGSIGEWTIQPAERLSLIGVYYDTADLALLRAGMSLRFRDGWLVKLPQPTDRPELLQRREVPFEGGADRIPLEAVDLVRAVAREREIVRIATLSTARQVFCVVDAEGSLLAEVTHDQVTAESDGEPVAFQELEIELTEEADPKVIDPVVARLRDLGAGSYIGLPKVARALGMTEPPSPEVVVEEVHPSSTAGDVVRAALARSVRRFIEHAPVVILDEDPEGVHQARVATRRLRSDLRVFRSLLDRTWADGLRANLRWLTDLLGGVRDLDVMAARFGEVLPVVPAPEQGSAVEILETLERERKAAVSGVVAAFREPFYVGLLDQLIEAAVCPPLKAEAADVSPAKLVRVTGKPWRRLRRAVDALPQYPSPDELHRLRIRTKRARYAVEAVAEVGGVGADRFAVALEDLQDVLGEHQDAVVAAAWLRGLDPRYALAAGELIGFEIARANRAAEGWRDIWLSLNRPELTAWLG